MYKTVFGSTSVASDFAQYTVAKGRYGEVSSRKSVKKLQKYPLKAIYWNVTIVKESELDKTDQYDLKAVQEYEGHPVTKKNPDPPKYTFNIIGHYDRDGM